MSFHHLDAPEYQGPGVTQLHDTAIEAGLVTAPERPVPDDVQHYNKQLQRDEDKRRKQLQRRADDDSSSSEEEDEEEEDEELMHQMRERLLSQLKQQHDSLITAATTTSNNPATLLDITEQDFAHHCLTSSHHHLTLLLLHANKPACLHLARLLGQLGAQYPSAVRCLRLRASGDNIVGFSLAACPTVLAYSRGKKVGQWGVRDWKGKGGGGGGGGGWQVLSVRDVGRELRQCGLLEGLEEEAGEEDEEVEVDERGDRLRMTRGTVRPSGGGRIRRGRDDSSDDDDDG